MLLACNGVPHQELEVKEQHEAMVGAHELKVVVELQGEASGLDAVGRVEGRNERHAAAITELEVTEEGRAAAVVVAEAAGESWDGGDATPALADGGGAGERGRLRREVEEDLGEQVVV